MPPTHISHYRLTRRLGEGTYGEVWKGVHVDDADFVVAVKLVHPSVHGDPNLIAALRQECRALDRMDHPGIVRFRELVVRNGVVAMVLELLEGEDLEAALAAGPQQIAEVERILERSLEGLAYAHAAGVLHRDIKPGNIFRCNDGRIKLMDFGLARAVDGSGGTRTGTLKGTLDYMAPERFGNVTTASADVYALGLVAWELLAGRRAVPPGDLAAKMGWHRNDGVPDVRTARADCPAWLAALVTALTAREPSERAADGGGALALLRALRSPPASPPLPAAPAPSAPETPLGSSGWARPEVPPTVEMLVPSPGMSAAQAALVAGRAGAQGSARVLAPALVPPADPQEVMAPRSATGDASSAPAAKFDSSKSARPEVPPTVEMPVPLLGANAAQGAVAAGRTGAQDSVRTPAPVLSPTAAPRMVMEPAPAPTSAVPPTPAQPATPSVPRIAQAATRRAAAAAAFETSLPRLAAKPDPDSAPLAIVGQPRPAAGLLDRLRPIQLGVTLLAAILALALAPAVWDVFAAPDEGGLGRAARTPTGGARVVGANGYALRLVPAGTYLVGCAAEYSCTADEAHARTVTLSRSILVGETEVTQALYTAMINHEPWRGNACPAAGVGERHPAYCVNWYEAAALANALSASEGIEPCYEINGAIVSWPKGPACMGYRLPTEAEWEVAARAEGDATYAGGGYGNDVGWTEGNSQGSTHPVGELQANAYGIVDMIGNVAEWTWNGYAGDTYSEGGVTHPTGPASESHRVVRGGSWYSDPRTVRVASRGYDSPDNRSNGTLGVRLVRSVP
jgi:formylglycine-generating enzyme required for sulfatase activity